MVVQFDEIIEKFLRPRELTDNLDHSTWSDETQVWIRTDSSSSDVLAFMQGSLIEKVNESKVQVKLFNGKVSV